jgi:hypothetical protein
MGEVFLAEHLLLGRKEALKILMPQVATDPQFVSRFRREARAVNRLRHPNIIALYDFGSLPDGRFYLSMEYAEGRSVFHLLRKAERFSIPNALYILGQLAYAVHHAHSRGVLHRDLKPGNLIVVNEDQTLKVLDFGMAKIVASDHDESMALSTGNVIWGTAKYMSPERVTGTGNDPRIDLYAIGCLAYEFVVGVPPFTGSTNEILHAHVTVPPPVASVRRPEVPPELDRVILRCLEKKPEDRYQTAAELFAALHKVPGYPEPRIEARRRYVPIEHSPVTLSTRAPTDPDEHGNVRGALRLLAEALLDAGIDDTRLVSGVAYLRDHERSLARLEAAQDALEHEAAAVRETVGDREVSLRFAIGELRFAATESADDAAKLRELETRLATAAADGDRLRAIQRGIRDVAAVRTEGLDKLKAAYAALEAVVDEVLPRAPRSPTLDDLTQKLALVRSRRAR